MVVNFESQLKLLVMRNLKLIIFGIIGAVLLFGCSSEGDETTNGQIQREERTVGSIYPEFSSLFATLYGTNYNVSNTTTTTVQDGVAYKYNTVTSRNGSGVIVTKGYLLEMPGNVLYFEHNPSARTIREFDWNGSHYLDSTFFVGNNSFYNSYGFSPANAPVAQGRFWGKGPAHPSDQLYNCGSGCCRVMVRTYSVFWIEINDIPETDPHTGGPLFIPAECNGSEGPYPH